MIPVQSPAAAEFFLIGRILFGGALAYLGLSNMWDASDMVAYARSEGVPAAGLLVPTSFAMLILGGLGILLGAYPVLATGAVVAFFVGVTPSMHAFWRIEDPGERSQEKTQFLVNFGLLGAAIIVLSLALGSDVWAYGLNITL